MATSITEQPEAKEVTVPQSKRGIRALIEGDEFKSAVKMALPKAMRPERFVRVALNAVMRQPDLLNCTRESFFRCMLDLSMYGLEPDGRRAHLIPFRNNKECVCGHPRDQHRGVACTHCTCKNFQIRIDCTLIIDYKGLVELVRRSGEVSFIHADIVYENDEFEFAYGSESVLKHRPNMEDRGNKKICVYSFVRLKDGTDDFIVMPIADVNKVRSRSRAADSGPWVSDYDEMAKKTVFRRHSKWLPLSPEVRDAVEHDDEQIDFSAINIAEKASISLDQFRPSIEGNRGHDATSLPDQETNPSPTDAAKDATADAPNATEAPTPTTAAPQDAIREYPDFPDCPEQDGIKITVNAALYVSKGGVWKKTGQSGPRQRGQMNFTE